MRLERTLDVAKPNKRRVTIELTGVDVTAASVHVSSGTRGSDVFGGNVRLGFNRDSVCLSENRVI